MSSTATPISAQRFAEAIKELPLANLHFKAAEIRNSIAHLLSSNQQLQPLADQRDSDCAEAIQENLLVIQRMKERIRLVRGEVEGRGFKWVENDIRPEDRESDGHAGIEDVRELSRMTHAESNTPYSAGRLGDEELARTLREQMDEVNEDGAQEGLHL